MVNGYKANRESVKQKKLARTINGEQALTVNRQGLVLLYQIISLRSLCIAVLHFLTVVLEPRLAAEFVVSAQQRL